LVVSSAKVSAAGEFPLARGEMADAIRAFDWSATALGPMSTWPTGLKAALGLILPAQAQVVLFWGPDYFAFYNDAYAPTIGNKHPGALGRPARENWSELWDDLEPLLQGVMDTGATVFAKDRPFYIERHGYPENVYFDISYSPIPDDDGAVGGVLCIVSETTDRIRAQLELTVAQERLSLALSTAGMIGVFDWHVQTDRFYADERLAAMFVGDAARVRGGVSIAEYLAGVHPEDADRVRESFERAVKTGKKIAKEYRIPTKEGGIRWVETRGECLYEGGQPLRFLGVVVDITEQVEAQERQRLVFREMNHRVKNIFAVFHAMIALSARSARDPKEMAESLSGRLAALMRAKELVRPGLKERETGQSERTTVDALVRTILKPYDDSSNERLVLSGPDVPVSENAATSLALALHETATNAAKYGALSSSNGKVGVEWSILGEDLRLEWKETGGPQNIAAPQNRGFGSVLTERSVRDQLHGTVKYDWRRAGLNLEFIFPLASLER
jgi:two-component sensor histidine kinase